MADTLGANECPICRFDHLTLPVTVTCPDHGHRLIGTRGRMTCPGHRCRYWRPLPDDERKPGTVSDSQLTALAAQGVRGLAVQGLSYHEAAVILVERWRQAAAQMRQHLEQEGANRRSERDSGLPENQDGSLPGSHATEAENASEAGLGES